MRSTHHPRRDSRGCLSLCVWGREMGELRSVVCVGVSACGELEMVVPTQYFVLGWVDFRGMGKRVDFFCTVILRKWQEIGWLLRSMYKLKERHFRYALPLL